MSVIKPTQMTADQAWIYTQVVIEPLQREMHSNGHVNFRQHFELRQGWMQKRVKSVYMQSIDKIGRWAEWNGEVAAKHVGNYSLALAP